MKGFESLSVTTVPTRCGSTLHCHHSDVNTHKDKPVLILIHGWPQSKFVWRHIIPRLSETHRLLVADLPGYGESTPSLTKSDRITIGKAFLEATREIFGATDFIVSGHDRGARTSHKIASHWPSISKEFPTLNLVATCLFDIVPYKDQWERAINPKAVTGFFHWVFLARPDFSIPMMKAYGGGKFAKAIMMASRGTNEAGRASLEADGAIDQYAAYFDRHSNIEAASADYTAGANEDYELELEDLKSGDETGKIGVPTLVLYSTAQLGKSFDMPAIWKRMVIDGTDLRCVGIGEGMGHYLAEEAPKEVLEVLVPWLQQI